MKKITHKRLEVAEEVLHEIYEQGNMTLGELDICVICLDRANRGIVKSRMPYVPGIKRHGGGLY